MSCPFLWLLLLISQTLYCSLATSYLIAYDSYHSEGFRSFVKSISSSALPFPSFRQSKILLSPSKQNCSIFVFLRDQPEDCPKSLFLTLLANSNDFYGNGTLLAYSLACGFTRPDVLCTTYAMKLFPNDLVCTQGYSLQANLT